MYIEEIFKRYVLFTSQQVLKKYFFFSKPLSIVHTFQSQICFWLFGNPIYIKGHFWGVCFFQLNAFCLTSRNNNMFNCLKFDYIVYRLIIPKQNVAKQDMTIETPVWLWYMSFPAKAVLRCKKFWIYFDWSTQHKQNVRFHIYKKRQNVLCYAFSFTLLSQNQ